MYTSLTPNDFKRYVGLPNDYVVEGLLLYGSWDLHATDKHIPLLKNALDKLEIDYELNKIEEVNAGHAHEITIKGKHYWFVPVMGTAVMSIYAHIASVLGSKKNILIGVVGGLSKNIKAGDLIIPRRILGNDNALKYEPKMIDKYFYPDDTLRNDVLNRVPQEIKVHEGDTITCEVMLAETQEDVLSWSSQGFLGVEMEGAMVFALSKHFSVPAAAIFSIADNLIEEETLLHESYKKGKNIRMETQSIQYQIAIKELLNI